MARRRYRSLLLPLLFLAQAPVSAQAPDSANWVAYDSKNFTVFSDRSDEEVLGALERFELFRIIALRMLNLPDLPENERLRIIMFGDALDYRLVQPAEGVAAYFYNSLQGPRMVVGPLRIGGNSEQTLFHEYVHYLMSRHSDASYPTWYGEGLAQVLQTTRFEQGSITVGAPPPSFDQIKAVLRKYRPLRVSRMIDLNQRDGPADFYATSWLMVHYLFLGSVDDATGMERTADFLLRYDSGEDPEEAFVLSFGTDTRDMDRLLLEYSDDNTFNTIVFPEQRYDGGLDRRALSAGEIEHMIANVAVEFGRVGVVHYLFDQASANAAEAPADAVFADRMKATRAIAYIHEPRVDDGDALAQELMAASIDDVDVLADMTHYNFDRYSYADDKQEAGAAEHLERAIELGERAGSLDPANNVARYYLALAYEQNDDLPAATATMLAAYTDDTSNRMIALALARILIKQAQIVEGSYLISRAYSASHTEDEREALRQLQLRVEAEGFDVTTIDALMEAL